MPLKRELATLLVRLARSSDASLQRLRRGTALIADVARRLLKTRDEALRTALSELLGDLARYDVSADELAQLLTLAADESVDVGLRVRLLHTLAHIADREAPPAVWRYVLCLSAASLVTHRLCDQLQRCLGSLSNCLRG